MRTDTLRPTAPKNTFPKKCKWLYGLLGWISQKTRNTVDKMTGTVQIEYHYESLQPLNPPKCDKAPGLGGRDLRTLSYAEDSDGVKWCGTEVTILYTPSGHIAQVKTPCGVFKLVNPRLVYQR